MLRVPFLEPEILTSIFRAWLLARLDMGIFAGMRAVTVTFLGISCATNFTMRRRLYSLIFTLDNFRPVSPLLPAA
jgi:hypothetical protein